MPIAFYMDHHVPRAITLGLRVRKVEVLTAYEDGTSELGDAVGPSQRIGTGSVHTR